MYFLSHDSNAPLMVWSHKSVKANSPNIGKRLNIKEEFRIELIEKLINLLQEEIRKYGEKIKKA